MTFIAQRKRVGMLAAALLGLGAAPALASENPPPRGAERPIVDLSNARVGDLVARGTRAEGGGCVFPEFTQVIQVSEKRSSVEVVMDLTPDCRLVVKSMKVQEATASASTPRSSPKGSEVGIASLCTNWKEIEVTHGRQDTTAGAYTEVNDRLRFEYNCPSGVASTTSAGPDWSAWNGHFTLLSGGDYDRPASSGSVCTAPEGFKSTWRRHSDNTTHELRTLHYGCNYGGYGCSYEWAGTLYGSQYTKCQTVSSG